MHMDIPENNSNTKVPSVLITGGSGLVGTYLTNLLLSEGFNVSHLSRKASSNDKVKVFKWEPEKKIIDSKALEGLDFIVHLAGANIGEKRWSSSRKEEIIRSRVDSSVFLHEKIAEAGTSLKAFISASATGYYGSVTSEKIFHEDDEPGNDFLGNTSRKWEEAADLFRNSGIRTVKIRTAVVLEKNDSALAKLMLPGKFGLLLKTGNGEQYMPWIHIIDLCGIYLKAIEDAGMAGPYNAVAPYHVSHSDFMNILGEVMGRHVLQAGIPSFILRAALGEMSDVVLKGSRVSSEKIINSGYSFIYRDLHDALTSAIHIY